MSDLVDNFKRALKSTRTPNWLVGAYLVIKDIRIVHHSAVETYPDEAVTRFMLQHRISFDKLFDEPIVYLEKNFTRIRDTAIACKSLARTLNKLDPCCELPNVTTPESAVYKIFLKTAIGGKQVVIGRNYIETHAYTLEHGRYMESVFRLTRDCLADVDLPLGVVHHKLDAYGKLEEIYGIPPANIVV